MAYYAISFYLSLWIMAKTVSLNIPELANTITTPSMDPIAFECHRVLLYMENLEHLFELSWRIRGINKRAEPAIYMTTDRIRRNNFIFGAASAKYLSHSIELFLPPPKTVAAINNMNLNENIVLKNPDMNTESLTFHNIDSINPMDAPDADGLPKKKSLLK